MISHIARLPVYPGSTPRQARVNLSRITNPERPKSSFSIKRFPWARCHHLRSPSPHPNWPTHRSVPNLFEWFTAALDSTFRPALPRNHSSLLASLIRAGLCTPSISTSSTAVTFTIEWKTGSVFPVGAVRLEPTPAVIPPIPTPMEKYLGSGIHVTLDFEHCPQGYPRTRSPLLLLPFRQGYPLTSRCFRHSASGSDIYI